MNDTLTPLADASGHDLVGWALRVQLSGPLQTIKCTVEQAEKLAAMSGNPAPEIRFGMDASVLGTQIEWVADPTESTFFAGRALAAVDAEARKLAAFIPVSREMLEDDTRYPPSEEDVARWRTERETRHAREDARHADLLAAGGVATAVAELHSPDEGRDCRECQWNDLMAPWPCTTWERLDEAAPR